MTKLHLKSFDFLRAACALMVMAGHLYTEMGLPQNKVIFGLVSFGVEAVVGFFVLSGCLLSMRDYGSTGNYLRARLVRILPNYYLVLILSVAGMVACGMAFPTTHFIANALFLQTLYLEPFKPVDWYAQSWSLSYEVWYYVIFIAVMARPRLLVPLFGASVAVGILVYFIPWSPEPINALLRGFSFLAMWLLGVIVTRLIQRGWGVSMATGAFMMAVGFCLSRVPFADPAKFDFGLLFNFGIGFAFLVWALVTREMEKPTHVLHFNLIARGAVSAVALAMLWIWSDSFFAMKAAMTGAVIVFALLPELMVRIVAAIVKPTLPFMYYVGGLSYALYLVHYPLMHLVYLTHPFAPIVNVAVVAVLSFGVAHLLDYGLQPRISAALRGRKHA
jgi:peptidoglycan/LPS O-acetylase OafA/YrhL